MEHVPFTRGDVHHVEGPDAVDHRRGRGPAVRAAQTPDQGFPGVQREVSGGRLPPRRHVNLGEGVELAGGAWRRLRLPERERPFSDRSGNSLGPGAKRVVPVSDPRDEDPDDPPPGKRIMQMPALS
jgi:hypothetical protein